ncbi:DUF397 domain-containing protein [Actinomadura darangshiensis]|uniref:DUF397 domain-containing protein n=1 Tax=Actinomadura darangshiensis TaxID=705336 RepID=A0A4R5B1L6_9ACTN|nr:DUF397 domain-containing protein [Actinomadura darangshiensis]TDD79511.1 DUF397 domain-containing protein [Actinomadura darangshiensis]
MTHWRKSSHSGSQPENCVECALLSPYHDPVVGVRDSKAPDGPRLVLTAEAWRELLVQLKREL